MTRIDLGVIVVFAVCYSMWLTYSAKGRELVYTLGMTMLKKFTGFGKGSVCWIGNNRVWSVRFKDESRYCIVYDSNGLIVEDYATGGLAKIYDRYRRNLYTLVE